MKYFVEEDDLSLDWEDFKRKYPEISREDYERYVKEFQEV